MHPWLVDLTASVGSQEVVDNTCLGAGWVPYSLQFGCRLGPQGSAGWVPTGSSIQQHFSAVLT